MVLFSCYNFSGCEVASHRCYSDFYLVALVCPGYEDNEVVDSGYSVPSLTDRVYCDVNFLTFFHWCRSAVSVLSAVAVVSAIIASAATPASAAAVASSSSTASAIASSSTASSAAPRVASFSAVTSSL